MGYMKNLTTISGLIAFAFMTLMPVAANAQSYYGSYMPSYMQSPSYSYTGPSPVYVMPQSTYNTYGYQQQYAGSAYGYSGYSQPSSYGYAQPSSYYGSGYMQPS